LLLVELSLAVSQILQSHPTKNAPFSLAHLV
jgi:hypothetical protein